MPEAVRLLASFLLAVGVSAVPIASAAVPLAPAVVRAAGSCTGWPSDSVPPTTIRVLRTAGPANGTVQVVPFQAYVNVVMAAEWGPNDPIEALKAGAVAVKQYAWHWTDVYRGGTGPDGSCYDVVDSTVDQEYSPETRVPSPSELAAVQATWGESLLKGGLLFATHYNAGADVPCGANADGWQLLQISAEHCAAGGMMADVILQTYYGPNVQIVGSTETPGPGGAVAVAFRAQPSGGTGDAPFPVQPVVAVVDAAGQTVATGTSSDATVTLAPLASPSGPTLTCTGGLSRAAVAGIATFDGCQVSGAASGLVLVASAPGLAAASTSPFAVAPPAPALSLTTPTAVITWGQPILLSARLAPPGSEPPAGRPVHLERSTDGITWVPADDLVTGATGTATSSVRPSANSYYRLVFDGAPDLSPATSAPIRVIVRQLALLRPTDPGRVKTIVRGSSVTFTMTVRPAETLLPKARVTFTFLLKRGAAVVTSASRNVYVGATGTASWTWKFSSAGEWFVRAIANPTTVNANSVWSPADQYYVT
jgi:hypothetical protein